MRTRVYKKNFWFNEEEKRILSEKSLSVGMNESDYIRSLVLDYKPKEKPDDRFYEVMKTLRNTSNNLNQIAKRANMLGYIDVSAYWQEVENLNRFIDQIRMKFLMNERGDEK